MVVEDSEANKELFAANNNPPDANPMVLTKSRRL
jgi:hypothetical protein